MGPSVWLIAGPTASGKSALALRLAQAIGGEIVNADSMQLYADLRVLSSRPTEAEEALASHHLYGLVDASQAWSVGRWLDAARARLDAIAVRGRPAIVTGGTGLYFRALTQGLAPVPEIPVEVRDAAAAAFDRLGEAAIRDHLAQEDPEAVQRIQPGDRQRLIRALSVLDASGRALTAWRQDTPPALPPDRYMAVVLEPERRALYARCDARVLGMVEQDAVSEAGALLARNLPDDLPIMKAIGVRELGEHVAGRASLAEAVAATQLQTRRYAKRQTTWFRNQAPNWPRITTLDPELRWAALQAIAGTTLDAG
jgi:tRNA dimethylallyltransferase